jgi:hypothetical protein
MVSASILPTKGCAAITPDQLQALPFKVSGGVSPEKLTIAAPIGKSHSQPAEAGQDNAAGEQGQRLAAAMRPLTGNIAITVQPYESQPSGTTNEPLKLPKALTHPQNSK